MSVRRILAKTIDTDLEYEAIGIDLAKNCVSAALLTTDGEVVCIDVAGYGLGTTFPVPRNRLRFFKFGLPGQPLISRDRLALQFSRFFSLFPC